MGERGTLDHLYFQMLVLISVNSIKLVESTLKHNLGWCFRKPEGAVIMCQSLKQDRAHTFVGMLGHCMKNFHKPHLCFYIHIVEGDITLGTSELKSIL